MNCFCIIKIIYISRNEEKVIFGLFGDSGNYSWKYISWKIHFLEILSLIISERKEVTGKRKSIR